MSNIVFIPGLMCDNRLYQPQVALLSAHHNIFLASLTNYDNMEALAGEILENSPPQFSVVGLSMGGILAMEVFRQAPDRVERLALMGTNPRAEHDNVKIVRGVQMEAVKAGQLREVMSTQMIPKYVAESPEKEAIDALCLEMALGLGDQVFFNQSVALRDRLDQQETLSHVRVPTLILCGEEDQLCPIERHDRMKELIPHATYVKLPGTGHLSTLERPGDVNTALKEWLESEGVES